MVLTKLSQNIPVSASWGLTHWPLGNFRYLIFQIISVIDGWGISCEHALRWMSLNLTDDKSTLVQVMAWCHQATSHYLSQCWPRSLSPNGVTRPQWVKITGQNSKVSKEVVSKIDLASLWMCPFYVVIYPLKCWSRIYLINNVPCTDVIATNVASSTACSLQTWS